MILFEEKKLLERKIEILITKLLSFTHDDKAKSKGLKVHGKVKEDLKLQHEDHKLLEEEVKKKRPSTAVVKGGSSSVHS